MPTVPKHQSVRQSRRKASSRATLTALDPDTVEIPPLPEGIVWRDETEDWWHDIWSSPMSSEFDQSDIHGLYRLAKLIDDFWTDPSVKLSSEIRLVQQAYGLTPLDRRKLEWTIEQAGAAKAAGRRRAAKATTPPDAAVDPRLKIVD